MTTNQLSTDSQIKKAIKDTLSGDKQRLFTIAGCEGLELRIIPKGDGNFKADFRHRYRHPITGKRTAPNLGRYPAFTLAMAKDVHKDNLALLAQGIDPSGHKQALQQQKVNALNNTFGTVAKNWLDEQLQPNGKQLAPATIERWQYWIKPLIAAFGDKPVSEITPFQILDLCKNIQKKHIQDGNYVKGIAGRIFAHAVINGLIGNNPVLQLTGAKALKTTPRKHRPAITTPAEFAKLLNDIDSLPDSIGYSKPILQLLALTFPRIGDICAMKWADIDLQAKTWAFEPQKGKNRQDMVKSLIVPLACSGIINLDSQ